ncbi:MAG: PhzF family phenazine biosynthesis protein [Chloroflexota bacterium]|nr:PhzF family phenazine biosynthesis protein [Chloroflexota bacterium]
MTRRYRFRQVDVFTDRPLLGNPLAVFPEADGLSDDEMQAIAREMNLSETTFVLPPTDDGRRRQADYRVRIFMPHAELPFAGHPSIGTAWVLADDGRFALRAPQTEVRQELAIGVLPLLLRIERTGGSPRVGEIEMTQAQPDVIHRLASHEAAELATALGMESSDLHWSAAANDGVALPAVISTGLRYLVLPVRSLELLSSVSHEHGAAAARLAQSYGSDSAALMAAGNSGAIPDADVHARVMVDPRTGIVEDPATGSAAGPICVFLGLAAGCRRQTQRVVIEQGVEVGRPSRLVAEVDFAVDGGPTAARVSGSTVAVAEGWLTLR